MLERYAGRVRPLRRAASRPRRDRSCCSTEPWSSEARPWPFGGVLRIGTAVLTLVRPEPPDAHLSPAEDGGLAYHRPPRLRPAAKPVKIEVPGEPKKNEYNRAMLIGAAVPVVLCVVMVEVTKEWLYALFMITSPVMLVSQWMGGRKKGGKSHRQRARQYRDKMAKLATSWPRSGPRTRPGAARTHWIRPRSCSPRAARGGGCGNAGPTTRTRCGCG